MTAALYLVQPAADRSTKPCSTPGDDHEGPVRLYPVRPALRPACPRTCHHPRIRSVPAWCRDR